ncbi:MAG: hypothetical protein WDA72_04735 [Desulfomonilia bacterium]|nr:hypothetical protein [Deltaproteobacteria bacterium]MDX9760919.1 hypothetical protein [Desulfomonilia bacterium]HPW67911.1 hypothetical protein [Deltaproteobacteria bacterium]
MSSGAAGEILCITLRGRQAEERSLLQGKPRNPGRRTIRRIVRTHPGCGFSPVLGAA